MRLGSSRSSEQYNSLSRGRGIQGSQERSLKGKERKKAKDKRMSQQVSSAVLGKEKPARQNWNKLLQ